MNLSTVEGVHCHGGQSYQVCGNSCQRTCYDIALYPKCRRKCVEGCNCPEGQTLDPFGQCVAIHECPCLHKGVEYPPGHQELRPGARSPDLWFWWSWFISCLHDVSFLICKLSLVLAHRPAGTVDPLRFKNGTCWPTWLQPHKCIAAPRTMKSTLLANRNTNLPAKFAFNLLLVFFWLRQTRKNLIVINTH